MLSHISSSVKGRRSVVRAAWWAGKVANHHAPRLIARVASGSDQATTGVRPPAAGSGTVPGEPVGRELPDLKEYAGTRHNPVLVAEDVTDYGAVDFVADPFLFPGADRWHMFFEVVNNDRDPDAVIGHATSPDGLRWEYDQVVLKTEKHLSFPYVFEWEGHRYMIPETGGAGDGMVELYEAVDFPTDWRRRATPVSSDHESDDAVVFQWDDRWWTLVGDDEIGGAHLYYSPSLARDGWHPHPENPVITGRPTAARPAGRPLVTDDGVVLFYQDCAEAYGERVRAYAVTALDTEAFADRELPESPILEGTGARVGWNSGRMHHLDPWCVDGRWICAVDGNVSHPGLFTNDHWSIGVLIADPD
jgi:hypothetical protein